MLFRSLPQIQVVTLAHVCYTKKYKMYDYLIHQPNNQNFIFTFTFTFAFTLAKNFAIEFSPSRNQAATPFIKLTDIDR